MNEGDDLLDSDISSDYITSLMQSARTLLNENNINNITVKYVNTTNNPLRCSEITPKMHELSLPVWVFNIGIYLYIFFISFFFNATCLFANLICSHVVQ